jgi:hypothetical protein
MEIKKFNARMEQIINPNHINLPKIGSYRQNNPNPNVPANM